MQIFHKKGFVSTVAPRAADEFGALPYELWALVAQQGQVMVQSSINSWVVCNETEGALSTVSTGSVDVFLSISVNENKYPSGVLTVSLCFFSTTNAKSFGVC